MTPQLQTAIAAAVEEIFPWPKNESIHDEIRCEETRKQTTTILAKHIEPVVDRLQSQVNVISTHRDPLKAKVEELEKKHDNHP